MERRPHVVIIGGGFGGLEAARRLAQAPVNVTLLDRRNHHLLARPGRSSRNRVLVLLNWAWSFATFTRGARLITGGHGPLPAVRTLGPDGEAVLPTPAAMINLVGEG